MAGYQPKKRKMTAEINVVPYIDVMLVLLIIFMATAPAEREVKPDSPVAVGGDAATPYADVVLLLDELSRAGIPKVGLMTDIRE
ncbi:biopolymer transporter ExbD [Vibrio alginolyticus]